MTQAPKISIRLLRYWIIANFWILFVSGYNFPNCSAAPVKTAPNRLVEQIDFDWNHSGKPTRFVLSSQLEDSEGAPDTLTIHTPGMKPVVLSNRDDTWGSFARFTPKLKSNNMVASKRLLFIASGHNSMARIYLILVGNGYGCCVGSLTVLTPDKNGAPHTVFHQSEHLLIDIRPLEDASGIELIAQSSMSEAWATINAESYDPYRVYILTADNPARYDLQLSKAYTIAHYCQWVGPDYNEKFGAIQIGDGPSNCRTMTREQFETYAAKHPKQFPQE
jgi:hypothetical protein